MEKGALSFLVSEAKRGPTFRHRPFRIRFYKHAHSISA